MRSAALVALALLLIAAGVVGKQAYDVYSGINTITGVKVSRAKGEPTIVIPPLTSNRRITFLLLGSDNDQKKEEAAPLTQSMILVSVNPATDAVDMLSIPRDFWVNVPQHGWAKIDLAFKYGYQSGYGGAPRGLKGGVALARATVEKYFHVPIDYYGWVGLDGFRRVVDTFGGLTLDVQHPVLDDSYPNDIHSHHPYGYRRLFIAPGWQHLDGASALEYVRSRHGDELSDFARSARQQQVLVQLKQKITAMNVLMNLPALVNDLHDSVRTDLTLDKLRQLDQLSHNIHKSDIRRLVLSAPLYCQYGWSPDHLQSILVPNWSRILPVVHRMFLRPVQPVPATTSPIPTQSPTRAASTGRPAAGPTPTPTPRPVDTSSLPADLVYVQGGNMFEVDRNGSTRQLIWSKDAAMPSPSPDGKTLAFVRFTRGLYRYDKYASDVWLMDLASRRQHVLTHDESATEADNLWAAWPAWSPDARQILYSTDRGKLTHPLNQFGVRPIDLAVWSMSSRGTGQREITSPAAGAGGDVDPQWRPKSREFAYVRWSYNPSGQAISRLMLTGLSPGEQVALTAPNTRILQPAWDPDGKRIAFIQTPVAGGQGALEVADVRGSRLTSQRVLATGELAQPAFTPDGRFVSFLRGDSDTFAFYVVRADGSGLRRVTSVPGSVDAQWRPVWIP
jgi:LCP family protein required for cell wall assembly